MNKRLKRTTAILLAMIIFCAAFGAQATRATKQTSLDKAIESLIAVRGFKQAMISPDGARVAWVESLLGADSQPTPNSAINVVDLKNTSAAPRRITAGKDLSAHGEHSVA